MGEKIKCRRNVCRLLVLTRHLPFNDPQIVDAIRLVNLEDKPIKILRRGRREGIRDILGCCVERRGLIADCGRRAV